MTHYAQILCGFGIRERPPSAGTRAAGSRRRSLVRSGAASRGLRPEAAPVLGHSSSWRAGRGLPRTPTLLGRSEGPHAAAPDPGDGRTRTVSSSARCAWEAAGSPDSSVGRPRTCCAPQSPGGRRTRTPPDPAPRAVPDLAAPAGESGAAGGG